MSSIKPTGYLAMPASGKGRGVLVLHAWWGLNDTIKTVCKQLSEAGFVAFAPDLYQGQVTDQIDEAEILATALDKKLLQTREHLANATTYLQEQAESTKAGLAVIGFSLGAYYALDLSVNAPEIIKSVVLFYGTGPGDYHQSTANYLGHFAESDEFEPQSNVDILEAYLKEAARPVTFYQYSGTGHWFFESDRVQAYNEAASKLAWERTLAFLNRSAE